MNKNPTFAEWLKDIPLEERSLANAFAAGQASQQGTLWTIPDAPSKRPWRTVTKDRQRPHTIRGLGHLGEVLPQITDGIRVVVVVITTGRKFESHLDNLNVVRFHNTGNKKSESTYTGPRKSKKKSQITLDLERMLNI